VIGKDGGQRQKGSDQNMESEEKGRKYAEYG
jgi:hypothetical protein